MGLKVEALEVHAGGFHLGPLDLSLENDEYLILIGPNGAGKTITLEAIAGLRQPAAGRIILDGRDITDCPPDQRRVGYLPQETLLFPHLSVRRNILYGAHRGGRRGRDRVAGITALLGLDPLMDRMPAGLSGGERKRVGLGRALASAPALLLLDEPMAALDPNAREGLRATLGAIHRELGTTTIHVTHSFTEALAMGSRIGVMIGGRLLQSGLPNEVFSRPASEDVAQFIRPAIFEASDTGRAAEALTIVARGLTLSASNGDSAANGVATAPRLVASSSAAIHEAVSNGAQGALAARIIAVETRGAHLEVTVNLGIELSITLETTDADLSAIAPGATVRLVLRRD